jgi:hypothetical protein
MRTVHRVAAATALGLPVLLAAPGMAVACDEHASTVSQQADAHADQSNKLTQNIYIFNLGGDETIKLAPHQSNVSDIAQENDD